MMELLLQFGLVFALLATAVGCALLLRDGTHPAALLPGLWGVVGVAYLLLPHGLRPVALETWLLVVTCCLVFVLGSLAGTGKPGPERHDQFESTVWRPLLFWLALIGLPLFAYRAMQIAESAAFTESMLINLRIALTGEDGEMQTYGALGYLIPVAFTSTLIELACSPRRSFAPRLWIMLVASVGYSVMATGRTYLFLLFIALTFVALVQERISRLAVVWAGTTIMAVLFFGLGWLFNKIGEDSPNVNALSAIDALSLYLLGSLAGFDAWMTTYTSLDLGLNVFRSIMAVGAALGLPVQVVPLVKDYVYMPEPTNVYTVFLPYVQDFGRLGAVTFFAFFGWLHARLYNAARSQDPRWVILYALAMYPLLMQFFQDQYFSLLTTWGQFAVLIWLSFRRSATEHTV